MILASHHIEDYPEGIVLAIDKPYRWTSADVVRKVKFAAIKHFAKKNLKVGHAGTLDPLATGVLLVCIGPATRRAQELQDHDKEYLAGISFGATTPSYDLEKDVDRTFPTESVTPEAIRAALQTLTGTYEQIAPLFSAKSVDGVRAYEMARKLYKHRDEADFDAAAVEILHRNRVTVHRADLEGFAPDGIPARDKGPETVASSRIHVTDTSLMHLPHAEVRIVCSKGTYIRAFARDLGEALGTGAHLDSLCRTRSGDYRVEDALSLEETLKLFSW